jgi:peptide/nickel transport system ATP-binding protein
MRELNAETVLSVRGLTKHFPTKTGFWGRRTGEVRAVDEVSFDVRQGETLALVGESGSGKTTLGRMVVRAIEPTAGEVLLRRADGSTIDLTAAKPEALRAARRDFHMIFQDPYSSLNPRMTVQEIVSEPLINNQLASGKQVRERVVETLELVGLGAQHLSRYPNAFSGGQRQRLGIARSLVCRPRLIVCDEAVSALDVSIQAQILNLLKDLQAQLGLSYLFISHDLAVVEHLAHRVAVMYVGKIIEIGDTAQIFSRPRHPYTEALLSSVPVPALERQRPEIVLRGEVANPSDPPSGCHFHPRCNYGTDRCATEVPVARTLASGQVAACHYAEDLRLAAVDSGEPASAGGPPAGVSDRGN